MNPNKTEIVVILDKSSSMAPLQKATIEGFNGFIAAHKAAKGECNITLVQFDHQYQVDFLSRPVGELAPLGPDNYTPSGSTALLDAVAKTIDELGGRLKATPEESRPGKVLVLIITDGEENSSTKFTKAQVAEMVKHQQEKYSWSFVFLGANIDAFHEAGTVGISNANFVAQVAPTPQAIKAAYSAFTSNSLGYRDAGDLTSATASLTWTQEQREDMGAGQSTASTVGDILDI